MNRELKFRFWNILLKKWESGMGIYGDDGKIGDFSECFHNEMDDPDSYMVVQQYTGLRDRNGKEIYEGDIISFNEGPFSRLETEVVFFCGCFQVYVCKHIPIWELLEIEIEGHVNQNK